MRVYMSIERLCPPLLFRLLSFMRKRESVVSLFRLVLHFSGYSVCGFLVKSNQQLV